VLLSYYLFIMPALALSDMAATQSSFLWGWLSHVIGWAYTIAWTISFWPQAILIYRRKSVAGMSLDFLALNFFGFFCYTIFNIAFLVSPLIQQQYRNTHNGKENLVRFNDAAFALHAFFIATWQFLASFYYKRAPGQRVAGWATGFLGILTALLTITLAATIVGGGDDDSIVRWIDFVNLCSYIKIAITLCKYTPQILLNFKRKSTRGFAIMGILLDVAGGILSLLQLFIDAQLINHDWSGVTGNRGKLGLSFISIFFDGLLMFQHYVLYGNRIVEGEEEAEAEDEALEDERQPLLQ
jgi:cystinosin